MDCMRIGTMNTKDNKINIEKVDISLSFLMGL